MAAKLLLRLDVLGALIGALCGLVIAKTPLYSLLYEALPAAYLYRTVGPDTPQILSTFNVIAALAIGFCLGRIPMNFVSQHHIRHRNEKQQKSAISYKLPAWPESEQLQLVLGEKHHPDGRYQVKPNWYVLPERGLYGNIGAFGGIGSGKTSGVAQTALDQFLSYEHDNSYRYMGGLVLDAKGTFAEKVYQVARRYRRELDVIKVCPGASFRYNPIHQPELTAEALSGRLIAVYQNITGDSGRGDNAWIQEYVQTLFIHCIGALRLAKGYITLSDVNSFMAQIATASPKELPEAVEHAVMGLAHAHPDGIDTLLANDYWHYHQRYFFSDWVNLDARTRAIVYGAAKSIVGLFDQPEIKASFCPAEEEITFADFNAAIDQGLIIVLDMHHDDYGPLVNAVGTLISLAFQRAVLARQKRKRVDDKTNITRPVFFICDEYQNFVSVSGNQGEGDDNFYALSRENRCVSLVLTQSPISLIAKIGEDRARVIFNSLRTKIFLALVDAKDAELAADLCGQDWAQAEQVIYNQRADGAAWNPVSGSVSGRKTSIGEARHYGKERKYLIEPVSFMRLRTLESIVVGFDGIHRLEPTHVYLKTDFVPPALKDAYPSGRTLPYYKLIAELEKGL